MGKTVLILGAHGRFGHHATVAFNSAGWTVRSFDRSRDNLMQAAQGGQVIVAGWNPLGHIRVELEAAYRRDGVRTILLRAGDFLDTRASGNWFDRMTAPSLAKDK